MNQAQFNSLLGDARGSREYQIYLRTRDVIFRMLENMPDTGEGRPSNYWQEEVKGFQYMFDASPFVVNTLRHHSYHLTGIKEYEYRDHHSHRAPLFRAKLELLKSKDKNNLLIPEAPELGGFGHLIDGARYNIDTLKFYECLIGMDMAGVLDQFRGDTRNTVLETGSGWGGFAYQFKRLFPNTTYVLVDLPASLLFSAVYLQVLFPNARVLFIDGREDSYEDIRVHDYDFVFAPHYALPRLNLANLSLGINMVSYQEMTTEQVKSYIHGLASWGCPTVYSLNRDRSPHNKELSLVSKIMSERYDLLRVDVLPMPYTDISFGRKKLYSRYIKDYVKNLFGIRSRESIHAYRHLVGKLKSLAN